MQHILFHYDSILQASKEFSDPRLRVHVLTVLKGMQSRRKASSSYPDSTEKRTDVCLSDEDICIPVELFQILKECEKQKNPGVALLMKAKDLSWSILAMIASCFSDVSPLSCLTVWLEITAARLPLMSIYVTGRFLDCVILDNILSPILLVTTAPNSLKC